MVAEGLGTKLPMAYPRVLQTKLSTEQPSLIALQAIEYGPRDYFADRRCLPLGLGLIPVSLFHSILCNHQLPHRSSSLAIVTGYGICLVSKWLMEVVQAAAGLDSGMDSGNEQHARISLCTDLLMRKKLRVYPKF